MDITIISNISSDDLAEILIRQLQREQLFQIIKDIDEQVADWDFTNLLYYHFKELNDLFKQEFAKNLNEV